MPGEQLHVSAVTIGETQAGIELTREHDAARAAEMEDWLEKVPSSYGILPTDAVALR